MSAVSEQHYRGEAGQRYQQQKRSVPEAAIPWLARLRAEKFQELIRTTDSVVELGVGLGWNLMELKCGRRIGTDLEDYLSPELKTGGIEFRNASSEIADETAEVVICHHVLEHVEQPVEMLREIRRILKPRGTALIFVPYEKEARYRRYDSSEPNHHLYSWNVQTLGNLVASQQLTLRKAEIGEFGYDRFAAKLALRMRLGESGFRAIRGIAHSLRPGREVRIIAHKEADGGKA
jgi:SAM-dependent methyltransferase